MCKVLISTITGKVQKATRPWPMDQEWLTELGNFKGGIPEMKSYKQIQEGWVGVMKQKLEKENSKYFSIYTVSVTTASFCVGVQNQPSIQFSHSVVSDSLQPHEPQHTRPPCSSSVLQVYPNSCPLSQWCHLTFSFSVAPFSSCLQSFLISGSFPMNQLFASGGQNIGISASISDLPMNTQD